jgi:hypothetical protein
LIDRRPLPDRPGLDGAPLERLDAARISAVTSALDDVPAPSEASLWTHEAVLEALLEDGPVLPLRFGVAYVSERALRDDLDDRGRELEAALEHVRGKVEIGVRVLDTSGGEHSVPAETGTGPGTRFLLERLQRRRDAAERAQPVRDGLAPLAVAERTSLLPQPDTLLSAAYLVDSGAVAAFELAAARIERSCDTIAVLCTGPWPPYNFAEPVPAPR